MQIFRLHEVFLLFLLSVSLMHSVTQAFLRNACNMSGYCGQNHHVWLFHREDGKKRQGMSYRYICLIILPIWL